MEYIFEKIGKRIKEERKKKNWTQKKMIEKLNPYYPLGRNTLSDIENGTCPNISLNLFSILCKEEFFNCDIGYLLCEYNEKQHIAADIKESTGLDPDAINVILNMKERFLKLSILNGLLKNDYFLAIIDGISFADYHTEKSKELDVIEKHIKEKYDDAETMEERNKLEKRHEEYRTEQRLHDAKSEAYRYKLTLAFSRLLEDRYGHFSDVDESHWKRTNKPGHYDIF